MNSANIIQRLLSSLPYPLKCMIQPVVDVANLAIGYCHASTLVADAYNDAGVSHYLIGAPPSATTLPQIHPTRWATQSGATPSVRVDLTYLTRNTERFAASKREFMYCGTLLVCPNAVSGDSSAMVDDFMEILFDNLIAALVPETARQLLQEQSDWGGTAIYIVQNRAMSRATRMAHARGVESQLYTIARHVIRTNEPAILVFTPGLGPFRLWRLSCKHAIGPTIHSPERADAHGE
jgi:hypothetical protein